jgi:DNA-binding CsgD family transcriptional regulator
MAMWGRYARPQVKVVAKLDESYALMLGDDWKAAADAWEGRSSPYERALALANGPEEALRESLAILEKLKAGPLAAMVRRRLRELGVRGVPRGPRPSTRESAAGLTAREVEVLGALGLGLTNGRIASQLHLSAKTVDHHVCSILRKLEVRTRAQAVSAAYRRGILKMNSSSEGQARAADGKLNRLSHPQDHAE